ncbi:hypothetical protein [Streptomyces sp. NPDC020571]|uniref:hypothetical protein n=1 Tax=Streptomyces sp. NPDC020571 TaxID=3365079 RepID=UPI0037A2AC45
MARDQETRDAREPTASAMARWIRPRIDAGEVAPLPMPLLETLILGPGRGRRPAPPVRGRGVDLDEAARTLPERIWRSVSAHGT